MSTVTLSQRELKRRRKLGAEYVAPSPYTLKAALEKGDIFTKLSILVFGLGNIVHKQYVKGLLFLAGEVGFILFMIFSGAHDDLTLWDKLSMSMFGADNAVNLQALYEAEPGEQTERVLEANKLAAGIIYTAAGLPFMLSGEEYGKTKHGNDNSFDSGKEVNQIDWVRAARMGDLLDFYRTLIALRRANPDWFSAEHIAVEAPGDTVAYRVHDTAVLINPGHDDAALDARARAGIRRRRARRPARRARRHAVRTAAGLDVRARFDERRSRASDARGGAAGRRVPDARARTDHLEVHAEHRRMSCDTDWS